MFCRAIRVRHRTNVVYNPITGRSFENVFEDVYVFYMLYHIHAPSIRLFPASRIVLLRGKRKEKKIKIEKKKNKLTVAVGDIIRYRTITALTV